MYVVWNKRKEVLVVLVVTWLVGFDFKDHPLLLTLIEVCVSGCIIFFHRILERGERYVHFQTQ